MMKCHLLRRPNSYLKNTLENNNCCFETVFGIEKVLFFLLLSMYQWFGSISISSS